MNEQSEIRNPKSAFRWGNLRTKIIAWSFVPTAIILVVVAVVIFYAYQQVTEDLAIERNRELTRLAAGQFTAELKEYADLLDAEARRSDVYGNDPVAQRDALKGAGNRLAVFDGGALILDTFGTVVAAEPERPEVLEQNWSDRTYYRQMLRSQILGSPGPVFSDIVADGPGGAEVIVVAMPITGPQGEFVGTIAGMFRVGATTVSAFYGHIVKLRIGESGSAYLVDGNGRVIYHTDTDRIADDVSAQAVVQQVLSGQVGAIRTRDLDGRDIVASFAPVLGTSWGLVTQESWAALTHSSRGYGQFLLLLLVLGVVVPVLVVTVGVRRITRPIAELIGAAQEVAKGKFGQSITARTGDEIEKLAEQFNLMSAQLQESYAHLERRVAERTKELATLNAIAAVVSQSLDLEEILNDALDKTLQVMEIEAGGIYLLDEEAGLLTVAAQRGFSPQFVAEIDRLKVGEGFSGRVAQSGQPLVVRDISTDPRLTRMVVREEGLRSLAIVPLSLKGKVLGTLFAVTHGYREFTDQDVQLLTSIGHQIGVAIENARLFEAERRRRQEASVLAEIAKLISGTLDLDEVLRLTAEYAMDIFKVDHCLICLYEEPRGTLRCAVEKGFPPEVAAAVGEADLRPSDRTRETVLEALQPLIVEDVPADPHVDPQAVELLGLQSALMVPIEVGGRRLGAMQLSTHRPRRRHFTAEEGELALAMANQAAMAIDNARYYEAEQRRAEQFRVISEVGRRITSILAVDELLDQMARLIQEAFNYYHVGIGLIEGDEVVYNAGAGLLWDDPQFQFQPARLKVGEEGITGWVADTGEPLLVPDVSQEPRYIWMRGSETRSELTVPVKAKGEVIGVLDVQSDQLDAFDESDLLVLQSLAHQAAIAIENARLFKAEQRRAEQFRVISEVGRRVTSILAVDELLGEIARLLKETLGYYLVGIALIEGDELIFRAGAGAVWETPRFQPPRLKVGREGITGWVAQSGEPLLVPDVSQEPRYYSIPQTSEIRSELAVPLKTKEAVIGVLHVQSDRLDAFDESDLAVLQSLAHQAAIAIENARLFAEVEQRMRELEALYRAEEELNRAEEELYRRLRLDQLLQALLDVAVDLLQADKSSLMVWDAQRERLVVGAARGFSPKTLAQMSFAPGEGIVGRVAASGEPMVVEDTLTDPRVTKRFTEPEGICSFMHVPIKIGGQVFGVFNVNYAQPRAFGGDDLRLCLALAQRAALAIENARLYEQAQQVAVLEERQRLARELHDSVTQALYGVTLYAEAAVRLLSSGERGLVADHLRELRDTAQEALREMRLLIFELRPPALEKEGLAAALEARLEAVEERAGLETEFKVEGEGRLPPEIEAGLYRIAQEALNNALKHAQARRLSVHLVLDEPLVTLEITDDGIGFDPTTTREQGGLGLRGMEERVTKMGGKLTVKSEPGEGTTIRVEVNR